VRHIFASEPIEARAMWDSRPGDSRFKEVEETICATLRFPEGRIANFFSSFGASTFENYTVAGTKGAIDVYFGYRFETAPRIRLIRDQEVTEKTVPHVENFSGQTAYFSDCILKGVRPESDGEEGLADMRAMLAIEEAAKTGLPQIIVSPPRPRHPTTDMVRNFPPVSRRLLV
jgi:predicted dehydrogenase